MMWKPSFTLIQDKEKKEEQKERLHEEIDELYEAPRHPISDTTQFIVSSTTIDSQKIQDPRFKQEFENEILSIDKFAPLSNIDLTDQLLTRLIWMDMVFAKRMGMTNRARRKSLEILRLYNESRGRGGFFQDAMITQKQIITAKHQQEQAKRRWNFMRKKEPQQTSEEMRQYPGEPMQ